MATTIKSKQSGKEVKVELIDPKTQSDMMNDILGGCGFCSDYSNSGEQCWLVDEDEELDWWVAWSETEPLIWDARDNASEETIAKDDELIANLGFDLGALQDAECELFGINR